MRRTAIVLAVLALTLAGCSTKKTASTGGTTSPSGGTSATATLTHMPRGSVSLSWSPATHTITVSGRLTGLAPNSIHPWHIHSGSCEHQGAVVHPLLDLHADATGTATLSGSVPGVAEGIPATGWYVNVHTGPTLAPAEQFRPIACVDVKNSTPVMTASQHFSGTFAALPGAGNNVSGQATITLDTSAKTLTVHLVLAGLEPNTSHAAHIHKGSCAAQGPVAFPLQTVQSDASGAADVTTTVKDVGTLTGPLYVNIHNTTDLSTQVGFTPLACGDVQGV